MNTITWNPIQLTCKVGNKVTQYKTAHAYNTAFLSNVVRKTFFSYKHYTSLYNKVNKGRV